MTTRILSTMQAAEQAARILRDAMTADARGKTFTDQRERLEALQQRSSEADALLVSRAWALFDDYRHPHKRQDTSQYIAEVSALVEGGHGQSAAVLLERLYPSLEKCSLGDLAPCFDAHQTVARYIKQAKWKAKDCVAFVCGHAEEMYGTALIEWAVETLPIGKLKGVVALLVTGEPRPERLRPAEHLLRRVVERDKQAALLKLYLAKSDRSEGHAAQIMRAVVAAAPTGPVWASAIAIWLRSAGTPERKALCVALIEEALQVGKEGSVQRVASFVAAIVANLANSAEPAKESERQRIAGLLERLVIASSAVVRASRSEKLWYCALSGDQRAPQVKAAEGMHLGIAKHLALALRAKEEGNDSGRVLEALGVNLGMEPIADAGEAVKFDPERHEDLSGGLLPDMDAESVMCGWQYGEHVVLRARVKAR
jgi:hypothetical protein